MPFYSDIRDDTNHTAKKNQAAAHSYDLGEPAPNQYDLEASPTHAAYDLGGDMGDDAHYEAPVGASGSVVALDDNDSMSDVDL